MYGGKSPVNALVCSSDFERLTEVLKCYARILWLKVLGFVSPSDVWVDFVKSDCENGVLV